MNASYTVALVGVRANEKNHQTNTEAIRSLPILYVLA